MPPSVEHTQTDALALLKRKVIAAPMPPGVEHLVDRAAWDAYWQ